jgi:hypothetical protein
VAKIHIYATCGTSKLRRLPTSSLFTFPSSGISSRILHCDALKKFQSKYIIKAAPTFKMRNVNVMMCVSVVAQGVRRQHSAAVHGALQPVHAERRSAEQRRKDRHAGVGAARRGLHRQQCVAQNPPGRATRGRPWQHGAAGHFAAAAFPQPVSLSLPQPPPHTRHHPSGPQS